MTTPIGFDERFGRIDACRIAIEAGGQSTWVNDAKTGLDLIEQVESDIGTVIGDAAYDTAAIYAAAGAKGAEVVVPPVRRAVVSIRRSPLRTGLSNP